MYTCLLHFNHKYKGVWRCRDTRTAKRMGGGGRGEGGGGRGEGGGGRGEGGGREGGRGRGRGEEGRGGGLQFITRKMLVTIC